jgi:hypothetical protein
VITCGVRESKNRKEGRTKVRKEGRKVGENGMLPAVLG